MTAAAFLSSISQVLAKNNVLTAARGKRRKGRTRVTAGVIWSHCSLMPHAAFLALGQGDACPEGKTCSNARVGGKLGAETA